MFQISNPSAQIVALFVVGVVCIAIPILVTTIHSFFAGKKALKKSLKQKDGNVKKFDSQKCKLYS